MAFRLQPGCLLLAAVLCAAGAAAQTVIYSDSSTPDKLQSKVGVGVDEGGRALQAGVTMIGQDGITRVLPRITSEWKGLDFLDLDTVLSYDDLNGEGLAPTVDTSLLLTSDVAFVDRVEGTLRRKGASTSETVRVRFTRFDTDFAVLGGNPFGVATDVVTKTDGGL